MAICWLCTPLSSSAGWDVMQSSACAAALLLAGVMAGASPHWVATCCCSLPALLLHSRFGILLQAAQLCLAGDEASNQLSVCGFSLVCGVSIKAVGCCSAPMSTGGGAAPQRRRGQLAPQLCSYSIVAYLIASSGVVCAP